MHVLYVSISVKVSYHLTCRLQQQQQPRTIKMAYRGCLEITSHR